MAPQRAWVPSVVLVFAVSFGCSSGSGSKVQIPGDAGGYGLLDATAPIDRSSDAPVLNADVQIEVDAADAPGADRRPDAPVGMDSGVDVAPVRDAAGPDVVASADANASVDAQPACLGPVTCSGAGPAAGCDPVCQTGCGCNQRCTFVGAQFGCQVVTSPALEPYAACQTAADRCPAGAVCVEETSAACGAHCYRFCRADSDCGGPGRGRCLGEVQYGDALVSHRICSPPVESCDPTGQAACPTPGKSLPGFGCYLMGARFPEETVCDCAGTKQENQPCDFEHECRPGLECVKVGPNARCRRVCRLGGSGATCAGGQVCTAFSTGRPGAPFGYCL